MALRRVAADVLRVRRPELASVAGTGGRRFLSALSPEELTKMEKSIENRVRASMELDFDVRVREIVRCEMEEILKREAEKINAGLDIKLVLENAALKQTLSMQEDFAQQKVHFEDKIRAMVKQHEDVSYGTKNDVLKLKDECVRRADAADNAYEHLKQVHADFTTSSNAAVQKTQYELMAAASRTLIFAAIGGLCYYLYK